MPIDFILSPEELVESDSDDNVDQNNSSLNLSWDDEDISSNSTESNNSAVTLPDVISLNLNEDDVNATLPANVQRTCDMNKCVRAMQNLLDEILLREQYLQDREQQEKKLDDLFVDAAIKTALEDQNLQSKAVKDGRYVNLFKRLSLNSKNICEDAIAARELYNKEAQKFNEKGKKIKMIAITTEIKEAFQQILSMELPSIEENKLPIFLTKTDLEADEKYAEIFEGMQADHGTND